MYSRSRLCRCRTTGAAGSRIGVGIGALTYDITLNRDFAGLEVSIVLQFDLGADKADSSAHIGDRINAGTGSQTTAIGFSPCIGVVVNIVQDFQLITRFKIAVNELPSAEIKVSCGIATRTGSQTEAAAFRVCQHKGIEIGRNSQIVDSLN